MKRKFIDETLDRLNDLMQRNVTAKTYLDLSRKDNEESMELVGRIDEIVEAMCACQSRNIPDQERELYVFAETITDGEVALFKEYFAWFRGLGRKGPE